MYQPLPLSTLDQDGKPYRVDLIGNLRRNPFCPQNHLLDIFIRPLQDKFILPHKILDPQINSEKLICRQVSVGELGLYSPLSVLVNGSIYSQCTRSNIRLDIISDISTTSYISANFRDSLWLENNYIIPYSCFRLGLAVTAPITAVSYDGDPYSLLLPTAEVIRYFYLSSSRFNQHVFSSDILDDNILANPDGTGLDRDSRSFYLKIRKKFPDGDAGIISEFLSSEYARKNAQRIWGALIKAKHDDNTTGFSPKVGFPFVGPGRLSGIGIELPTPKCFSRKRSLVLKITNCKYELPFDSIYLLRDNPGKKVKACSGDPESYKEEWREESSKVPVASSSNKNGENNPLLQTSPMVSSLRFKSSDNRFAHVEVINIETESKTNKPSGPKNSFIKFSDQSSTPTRASNSSAALISIDPKEVGKEESREHDKSSDPDDFFKSIRSVISKICESKNIDSRVVRISSEKNSDLSYFPLSDSSWCDLLKPRRLHLSEVNVQGRYFYIMEIERFNSEKYPTILYFSTGLDRVSEGKQYILLKILSWNSFKRYDLTFNSMGFSVLKFKHISSLSQAYKIRSYILSI